MKIITEGYVYELPFLNNPTLSQQIKFHQEHNGQVITTGTSIIDLLEVLISKIEYDDMFEPSYENEISKSLLKSVLNHQLNRKKAEV